jgi:polysaccharide deacetylase 2 family uncharacterized protein YibQ
MVTSTIRGRIAGRHALALAWISLFSALALLAIATTLFGDPHAADPLVRLAIVRAPEHVAARTPGTLNPQTPALENEPAVPPALVPPKITQPVYAGRNLIADPALVEPTASGPLPRVASDGRAPMVAYAGATNVASGRPRIAIVISGLGISALKTSAALEALPSEITLAFAPYASDVQRWVGEARKEGHEVLVQVPMEDIETPGSDPGPHTLRVDQDQDYNTQRLAWALTRFTGYTGVTNMQGSRFLSDDESLTPMLTYVARRGLLFFDDGESRHSMSAEVAGRVGVPFAQSSAMIDSIPSSVEIDNKLAQLESAARANGVAVGSAHAAPVTVQRIALWAAGLKARGFVLVPASAVVSKPETR